MRSGIPSLRTLVLALGIVIVAAGTGEAVAGILYGAAHVGADNPSTLYRIDPTTGVATAIGPIGYDEVGGLAFHRDGRLYGVGKKPGPNNWVLIEIDPATGDGTAVGSLVNTVQGSGHYDISFHSDGTLYLTADSQVNPCVSLFTVDLASGLATEVGDTTVCSAGNALAFSRDDVLRHANADSGGTLYTVDQLTGVSGAPSVALIYVGFPELTDPRPNAIDVHPDTGVSYVSIDDGTDGSGPNYLATLDPATGDVTHIGVTVNGLESIAWRPSACVVTLYATVKTESQGPTTLYRLNPSKGTWVEVGPIGFDRVGSIDFHPVNGLLYGVAQRPSETTPVLIRINPISGRGTEIGPLDWTYPGGGHFDVSFRGSDDTLFMTALPPAGEPTTLFTIDIDTGLATEIGPLFGVNFDNPGNAIAFSRDDTLYHIDKLGGGTLNTLNQTTGAATSVMTLTYVGFTLLTNPRMTGMDFNPRSDVAYLAINDGAAGGGGPNYLATLDLGTGEVTNVVPAGISIAGLDGLAWRTECTDHDVCTDDRCRQCETAPEECVPTCAVFGSVHAGSNGLSTLYRIDPATGAGTAIGPIGFERVGSIDFDSNGSLFGVGERTDGTNTPILIAIDPVTGAGQEVGPLITTFIGGGHFDVSFRNADDRLFLTAYSSAGADIMLYDVYTSTGFAFQLGDLNVVGPGNAIAFSPSDTLYHIAREPGDFPPVVTTRYVLDQTFGAAGSGLVLTHPAGFDLPTHVAMDYDPCTEGYLTAVKNGIGSSAPIYLSTVDISTGDVAVIGQTVTGLSGLASWPGEATCCHTPLDGPVVFPHTLFATAGDRFGWYLPEDVLMIKGDLSALSTYGTTSTVSLPMETSFTDAALPALGAGFYYLVRGDCGQASWISGGSGECSGPNPCPAGERDGNLP
jgi:hypothetical protein